MEFNVRHSQLNAQKGSASLMFLLCILGLFSLFTLAVDGSRFLQIESRLNDAAEVASVIMTATNSDNQAQNEATVSAIIDAYLPDNNNVASNVTRNECANAIDCGLNVNSNGSFVHYQVTATSEHDSWFPKTANTAGFDAQVDVSAQAHAIKLNSRKADVVFALNAGQNMVNGGATKLDDAIDIINGFNVTLNAANLASPANPLKVAVVPFNERTRNEDDDVTEVRGPHNNYDIICDREELILNTPAQNVNPNGNENQPGDVNYVATINNILTESNKKHCYQENALNSRRFYTLDLTADPVTDGFVTKLANFIAGSNTTEPYQGLIRAAQLINKGEQSTRHIILLTDGLRGFSPILMELINNYNLCDEIRSAVKNSIESAGKEVNVKMTLVKIGDDTLFGTEAGYMQHYSQCMDEIIYNSVEQLSGEDLYQHLMKEDTGHVIEN